MDAHDDSMKDELQGAIDASLRRLFPVPSDAGARAVAQARAGATRGPAQAPTASPGRASHTPGGGASSGRAPFLAVAAAVLSGLGLWFTGSGALPGPQGGPAPPRSDATVPGLVAVVTPPTPPTPPAPPAPTTQNAPDLDALYDRFVTGEGAGIAAMACSPLQGEPELQVVTLEERLAESYGTCLDVEDSDACALFGPYPVPEWPSATVVVAFCENEAYPTMLVLDDQTAVGCGFAPRSGTLSTFHKDVGPVAVWEVGERSTARLLDGIRACGDVR